MSSEEKSAIFADIPNHHRVIVDEGMYGPKNARVNWFLSVVEPNDVSLDHIARVEGIDIRTSGRSTEVVLLTKDAWRKIGELKGWL